MPFITSDSNKSLLNFLKSVAGTGSLKKIMIPESDKDRKISVDIDGALSYAMVWLKGHLVGGWPYENNFFSLDLTFYVMIGEENQIAIRLDNPPNSYGWYPGGGIYKNVWLNTGCNGTA